MLASTFVRKHDELLASRAMCIVNWIYVYITHAVSKPSKREQASVMMVRVELPAK